MSKASIIYKVPGDPVTAAGQNLQLTTIATATADINAINVADEGIDRINMAVASGVVHITAWDVQVLDTVAPWTYTHIKGLNPGAPALEYNAFTEVTHGGTGLRILRTANPIVMRDGDLMRLYYELEQVEYGGAFAYTDDGSPEFWILQPAWDITDGTLTHYVRLPDEGSILHGQDYPVAGTGGIGSEPDTLRSCAVCPVEIRPTGGSGASTYEIEKQSFQGSFVYEHSGADINIYAITFMISGPYRTWHTFPGLLDIIEVRYTDAPDISVKSGRASVMIMSK